MNLGVNKFMNEELWSAVIMALQKYPCKHKVLRSISYSMDSYGFSEVGVSVDGSV